MTPRDTKAAALLRARGFGVLATVSNRLPGYPFASIVNYAVDQDGRPLFLLSGLAVHSKNLAQDARASLFVFEGETLASARLNVMGEVRPVPESEIAPARALYLARHPAAAEYLEFGDFRLYRLAVQAMYWIGGFGEMGWVTG